MELVSGSHRIGQNLYHLEWCPKYRYNMFKKKENKKLCENILHETAQGHGIAIVEMCVMPDHIHMIVEIPPTMSVSKAFHLLKGASSYELFKRKPIFRLRYRKGHFWSPGKFYRTVGDVDAETTINYVKKHRIQQTTLINFCPAPAPHLLLRSPAINGGEHVTFPTLAIFTCPYIKP